MKKKLLFVAVAAIGILVSGCKSQVTPIFPESESGTLSVTLKSENPAVGRATGTPTQNNENTVHSFTVYVFDHATGILEKKQDFDGKSLTGEITGLNPSSEKRVVALVNTPGKDVSIKTYKELQDQLFDIGTQNVTDGLFMSGENSKVTLNVGEKKSIDVSVKRLVAKIILGSLTISEDAASELDDFTLEVVSIQKTGNVARALGGLGTNASNFSWIGGMTGTVSTVASDAVYEEYGFPDDYENGKELKPNIYFYVYENENTTDLATTLVLAGTYKAKGKEPVTMYYPFQVNTVKIEGGEGSPDGTGIKRNMNYTLNVTLKNLSSVNDDPDKIPTDAALDVAIKVGDWDGNLIQNEKR